MNKTIIKYILMAISFFVGFILFDFLLSKHIDWIFAIIMDICFIISMILNDKHNVKKQH